MSYGMLDGTDDLIPALKVTITSVTLVTAGTNLRTQYSTSKLSSPTNERSIERKFCMALAATLKSMQPLSTCF